jgi:UDP-N-acetylglucosamine 2-epimerase (non-hydrolysing)
MKPLKVLTIFGTRPEAIKMAPVIQQLQAQPGRFEVKVCVTAQHREMLDQVLQLFDIRPDIDLNIMRPNQSLADLTSAIFSPLDAVMRDIGPDWVLAQGDTTTVMVSALLAFYNRIHFGHVEAGLRTGDKWQPFPEEVNRKVAGVVADLHFAPTEWSKQNLLKENIPSGDVLVTGNPVIDALQWVANKPYPIDELVKLGLPADAFGGEKRIVLITAHRRENFGEPLHEVFLAIKELAAMYRDEIYFVYPVHMNPNVKGPAYDLLKEIPNIILLPPLDYLPLVHILKNSTLVLTDSGGLQEEAPGLGVPVLVLREVTERPEGVEAGTVRLVGTNREKIVSTAKLLLNNAEEHQNMARSVNPYGDGHAAERICAALGERG